MFANVVPLTAAPTTGSLNTVYTIAVIVLTLFGIGGVGGIAQLWRMARKKVVEDVEEKNERTQLKAEVLAIKHQVLPNGGSSITDTVRRIEEKQETIGHDLKEHIRQSDDTHRSQWAAIVEGKKQ